MYTTPTNGSDSNEQDMKAESNKPTVVKQLQHGYNMVPTIYRCPKDVMAQLISLIIFSTTNTNFTQIYSPSFSVLALSHTHSRPSPSPGDVARVGSHLVPLVAQCCDCVRSHVHEVHDDSASSDVPGHPHSAAVTLHPRPTPPRMQTRNLTRMTTRRIDVVCGIYSKLPAPSVCTQSHEQSALLDFFFPQPSLSITSAPQATRWRTRRWAPRSLSTPTAVALVSPEEGPASPLGVSSSERG